VVKKNYLDPKWQALRIEVLKRDHYKCRAVGCKRIATVVHHGRYLGNFEEPLDWLFSLCQRCHNEFHKRIKGNNKRLWLETLRLVGIVKDENIVKLTDDYRLSKSVTKKRAFAKRKRRNNKKNKSQQIKVLPFKTKKSNVKSKRGAGTPKGAEEFYEARRQKKREERLKHL